MSRLSGPPPRRDKHLREVWEDGRAPEDALAIHRLDVQALRPLAHHLGPVWGGVVAGAVFILLLALFVLLVVTKSILRQ
jgi:hypothetical protein